MNDRLLHWVGVGVLAGGMSTAMLLGAGIAAGETDSGDDGGAATSSQSTDSSPRTGSPVKSNPADNQPNSPDSESDRKDVDATDMGSGRDADGRGGAQEKEPTEAATDDADDADPTGRIDDDAVPGNDEDEDIEGYVSEGQSGDEGAAGEEAAADVDDADASSDNGLPDATVADKTTSNSDDYTTLDTEVRGKLQTNAEAATWEDQPTLNPPEQDTTETAGASLALAPVAAPEETPAPQKSEMTARLMMSAVEVDEPAPAQPTFINVLGTIAWSLFDLVVKTVVGPPAVPPGSTVTAGRSTLEIDCGDGYTTDADWYYPKEGRPEKLIYFQHGFLARAGVYNLTLTELAERNNAIVVAPSITSNFFACDGCSVTADPMHAAAARLFEGDRAALLASASAAGFDGTLPNEFVFAGQSAGAILAASSSGYYYASAPAEEKADMVGVLLFDGSAANGALARALDTLPSSVPVLHIAGVPTVINNGGDANKVLLEKRPGQFNGVQLIGGAHSDAFRSDAYFGLVQAFVGLAFGSSVPENVEAVQVLSQGWLTDMYEGRVYDPATRTGIYGDPGTPGAVVVDIPTEAGLARGYVLPGPPHALSPIEKFFAALLQSINSNDFAACATDPTASAPDSGLTQNSTPNAALSLDGRTQTSQSVGQHECTG